MVRTRLVTGTLASFAGALCLSGIMQAAGPVRGRRADVRRAPRRRVARSRMPRSAAIARP